MVGDGMMVLVGEGCGIWRGTGINNPLLLLPLPPDAFPRDRGRYLVHRQCLGAREGTDPSSPLNWSGRVRAALAKKGVTAAGTRC